MVALEHAVVGKREVACAVRVVLRGEGTAGEPHGCLVERSERLARISCDWYGYGASLFLRRALAKVRDKCGSSVCRNLEEVVAFREVGDGADEGRARLSYLQNGLH